MTEEELYDKIENYLDNKLSGRDLEAFKNEISTQKELKKKVELHRTLKQAILEEDLSTFKESMKNVIEQNIRKETKSGKIIPISQKPYYRLRIAIAAILIITTSILSYFYLIKPPNETLQDIAVKNLEYPDLLIDEIALEKAIAVSAFAPEEQKQILSLWQKCNQLYQAKKYTALLETLDSIRILDPDFDLHPKADYNYFLGIAQLKNKQWTNAVNSFQDVNDGPLVEEAEWLQAMTLLLLPNRVNESAAILEKISNSDNSKQLKAQTMLERIKRERIE